jgi:hypothetical protein
MEKALEFVVRKFPDHSTSLTDLYCTDEDFRILCEDYRISVLTVEECRLKVMTDRSIENEYLQVSRALEEEIFHLLQGRRK